MGINRETWIRIMAIEEPTVTLADYAAMQRPVLWIEEAWPGIVVGDVLPKQSYMRSLRKLLAGMDDLIFRPIIKLSPGIIGLALGFWGGFGVTSLLGFGAVAYVAPGDWYIARLSKGVLGGAAGRWLWGVSWSRWRASAQKAFGSLGGSMFEGGDGIRRWLFP